LATRSEDQELTLYLQNWRGMQWHQLVSRLLDSDIETIRQYHQEISTEINIKEEG